MSNKTPSIEEVKALDGRIFAMLSPAEFEVFDFYRDRGRKFDVAVAVVHEGVDPDELLRAKNKLQVDTILRRSSSVVKVTVGPGAATAWAERFGG